MCGIVGYSGNQPAQAVLLHSLSRLEYRGYDSCGIALTGSSISVFKDAVRVSQLALSLTGLASTLGIGHTRWATHGIPCRANAHPHLDCTGKIAVVHNGVITNYQKLKNRLIAEGHRFVSETDTEVIPHLIEKYYQTLLLGGRPGVSLRDAMAAALSEIEGSYALIVMAEGEPGLVFARKDSPLIIGLGDGEAFIASDVPAILDYTSRVIYLEDGDIGIATAAGVHINHYGQEIKRPEQKILWNVEQAHKGGYEHYMLKEIHEQPRVIRETLSNYLYPVELPFNFHNINGNHRSLLLLACGTSYHSTLVGRYVIERLTDISVNVEIASEYNYYQAPQFVPAAVGITQSGETADTLKAMRRLKDAGSKVIVITNTAGSTASRIADQTIYIKAGPEISVAATKSFTAQMVSLYWLALLYSKMDVSRQNEFIMELRRLPDKIQRILATENIIAANAARLACYEYIIYTGRGINYAIALEGALKLKEVSYIHSEAYAAGEIKHGPFALLNRETPVIAIVGHDGSYDAMVTNIKEIKTRGSPIFAIAEEGDDVISELADHVIPVPKIPEIFSPFLNAVVVQLLAYYTAKKRNCPIDFPRNLAKSVTVE